MTMAVLEQMIADTIRTLMNIGRAQQYGLGFDCCTGDLTDMGSFAVTPAHHVKGLVLDRTDDKEHRNLAFVLGGPTLIVQHQLVLDRWVILAAWHTDLNTLTLNPADPGHCRAIIALELTEGQDDDNPPKKMTAGWNQFAL